jgi:nucleoside-diphosphate-sugar epimerase
MKVLITGGTGFIGKHLTRRALGQGWQVNLLTRMPESVYVRALRAEGVNIIQGDLTEPPTLRTALEISQPDLLFHNAGWYELGIPKRLWARMWEVNVEGTERMLTLAAEYEIPKVVFTSTTTALGDTGGALVDEHFVRHAQPLSHYEQSKSEAHQIGLRHQAAGEPIVIACPAQAIGPGDHSPFGQFTRLFVRGLLPPMIWAPDAAFTFGYVEDVAQGLLLAGEKGRVGETYFLAGAVMTNREVMQVWGEVTGRRPPFIWLPRPLAIAMGTLVAPMLRMLGQPAFISPEVVKSTFVSFRYRSDKAIEELGMSFRSGEEAWKETLLGESSRDK